MIVTATLALSAASTIDGATRAVRTLESAGVSAVAVVDAGSSPGAGGGVPAFESTTLCGYLAQATSTIGVVAENSALYGFPYHAARRLATIDHLAHGRSGWLVRASTLPSEGLAYDWRASAGHEEELYRATEYTEIAYELWDSWDEGAKWPNKETGDYKDDSGIHPIDYRSRSFRVKGPLDVPPSPQRRPVVFAEIGSAAEAVYLVPYIDAAIVVARDRTEFETLVAAIERVSRGSGSATLVLLSVAVTESTDAEALRMLVAELGADGVAFAAGLDEPSASRIASLASALGTSLVDAADVDQDTHLATVLGIDAIMTHGGRAA